MENLKIKKEIRCFLGEEHYFCIIDVLKLFVECEDYNQYWQDLKKQLHDEQSDIESICKSVKVTTKNGEIYYLEAINLAGIMRIIQSISTSKADMFKIWLANLAVERFEEIITPKLVVERAVDYYIKKNQNLDDIINDVQEFYELNNKEIDNCDEYIENEKIVGIDDIIFDIYINKN